MESLGNLPVGYVLPGRRHPDDRGAPVGGKPFRWGRGRWSEVCTAGSEAEPAASPLAPGSAEGPGVMQPVGSTGAPAAPTESRDKGAPPELLELDV